MKTYDIIILCANVVITLVSFWGARKSLKYYKKSKNLTSHANLNKALLEIEKMQKKVPEALSALAQKRRNPRGCNPPKAISSLGEELSTSLIEIHSCIPSEYTVKFSDLEKTNIFNLQRFINECISEKPIIVENNFEKDCIYCQERLNAMQEFLKDQIDKVGEKLK